MPTINVVEDFLVYEGETLSFTGEPAFGMGGDSSGPADLTIDGAVLVSGAYGITQYYGGFGGGLIHVGETGRFITSGSSATGYFSGSWGSNVQNDGLWQVSGTSSATGYLSWSPGARFVNAGVVDIHASGGTALGVQLVNGGTFRNSGDFLVHGAAASVGVRMSHSGVVFENTGSLIVTDDTSVLDSVAILLATLSGTYVVDNSGKIQADFAFLEGQDFSPAQEQNHIINNTGEIIGIVDVGLGADEIHNAGLISGDIYLGEGADLYDGRLGSHDGVVFGEGGADTLWGGAGEDWLFGDMGADVIDGGAGDDVIDGGRDNDQLDGGAGFDVLSFVSATMSVVADFETGIATTSGTDTFKNFEAMVGGAFGDTLRGASTDDVLDGADGNDTLIGRLGDDVLFGGAGDDLLDGGSGDDWLEGESGNDTATYSGAMAAVTVDLRITAAQATGGAGFDTLVGIENLTGSAFADRLTGDGGINVLIGGKGDDVLDGGAGDDVLDGGDGYDTAVYAGATSGVKVSLSLAGAQNTVGAGVDTLIRMNNLTGSAFADVLTGDAGANVLIGGKGDDVLDGGAGNDRLDGGDGYDTAVYAGATSGVKVNLSLTGAQNTGGAGTDTLVRMNNLTGSAFADVLTGDKGANVLIGGKGDDVLDGGAGNDRLDGGDGYDTAVYASATSGVTLNLSLTGAQNTVGAGVDTLILIENATGSAFADTLTGNAGANVLIGGKGDDVLDGGAGDDRLDGGDGYDTAVYAGASSGVKVDLSLTGAQNTGGAGVDTLIRMNNLTGSAFADVLIGDKGANVLIGGKGDDVLDGGAGNDRLDGGDGYDTAVYAGATSGVKVDLSLTGAQNTVGAGVDTLIRMNNLTGSAFADVLTGDKGTNVLIGGDGDDVLDGGTGNDRLEGGAGDDILAGGAGDDLFVFGPAFGHDRIDDFVAGGADDRLDFSAYAGSGVTWTLTQVGEDAVFTFSDGSTLTLAHVQTSSLNPAGDWGWG